MWCHSAGHGFNSISIKSAGSEVKQVKKTRSDIPCIELSAVLELTQSKPKLTSLACDTTIPSQPLVPGPKNSLYVVDNINLRLYPPFVFL